MSFLDDIFAKLGAVGETTVLQELRGDKVQPAVSGQNGGDLLRMVAQARGFLCARGLKRGDRCVLLAPNSIRWIAMDLAIAAEGMIAVPLYARQAPTELVAMMKDCSPGLICCGDPALREAILQNWTQAPSPVLLDDVFDDASQQVGYPANLPHQELAEADPGTIIYTSGTSVEAKGVVLTAGNVGHMLGCTSGRLDALMENKAGQDRVFHYLPFCFAGSWIMLLTCLLRGSLLTLNTDLTKIAGEMRGVAPDYFLNVPALLERMRKAVDEQLWKTGGIVLNIYSRAKGAWMRKQEKQASFADRVWLKLAHAVVFPTIRKKMIGSNLKGLICGSAPLNLETQVYFMMLGIPVLQVYGLTETTAICTMDDPQDIEPGRVGPAIPGIEMKLGENSEILVRGPNIFPGYWHRPEQTAQVLHDGWFHTGDQGDVDTNGNWRISGRLKNLIILNSGHNIAPEPIEDELLRALSGAQQVVLIGNGRSFLSAIITGEVARAEIESQMERLNATLPHYRKIRMFHAVQPPFTIEDGLLTANGKLKRDAIAARFATEIEQMYAKPE